MLEESQGGLESALGFRVTFAEESGLTCPEYETAGLLVEDLRTPVEVCILPSGTNIYMIIRPDTSVVKSTNPVQIMVDETSSTNAPPRTRRYGSRYEIRAS
jgi:hypothetical protein